jgi:hypothetical protein
VLPQGLQFQSKPTPGLPPQFFELLTETTITAPNQLPAAPAAVLLGEGDSFLLQGAVTSVKAGDLLLLSARDQKSGEARLVTAGKPVVAPAGGGQQTSLAVTLTPPPPLPASLTAAVASLQSANQTANVWSFFKGAIKGQRCIWRVWCGRSSRGIRCCSPPPGARRRRCWRR